MNKILDSYTYQVVFLTLTALVLIGCVIVGEWQWIIGFIVGSCATIALKKVTE